MTWLPLSRLLAEGRPDSHPVAERGGVRLDFARFRADVCGATAELAGRPRAALACRDSYAFAVGLLALLHAGCEVVLPANTQPATLAELAETVVDDAWIAGAPAGAGPFQPIDPEQCGVTLFTSGSTGTPKAIWKSLGMLEREAATLHGLWTAQAGAGPVHATVSHQHLYGLAFKILWPLTSGIPFAAETHEVWETLLPIITQGSVLISSPAHLSRLGGLAKLPPHRRPALVFTAGAPLPAASAVMTRDIFGRLPVEIFGSSECGAVATRLQEQGDEAWHLLPTNEMRTDAEGRLSLRSPYVDGWQETADLVERVGDGFRFLGRADDVLKIEGERVSLTQMEAALQALPWVEAAAVLVLAERKAELAAVVVASAEGRLMLERQGGFRFGRHLRRALSAMFAPAVVPRRWRFVDSLPVRAMGKRDNAALAALFRAKP